MSYLKKFKSFSKEKVNKVKSLRWSDIKTLANKSWDFLKKETNETKQASEILKRMILGSSVTENEKVFLKEQSKDLIRIISASALPMPITAILIALGKKYNFSFLPGDQSNLKELIKKEKEEIILIDEE